ETGKQQWRGLLREGVTSGQMKRNIATAHKSGLQPIAHAIGDEANHILLNAYVEEYPVTARLSFRVEFPETHTYSREALNIAGARCRIEHAQHLLAEDIQRIGRMGVIASMQPFHKADDGRYAESYIGAQRARTSYAFKSLLDA